MPDCLSDATKPQFVPYILCFSCSSKILCQQVYRIAVVVEVDSGWTPCTPHLHNHHDPGWARCKVGRLGLEMSGDSISSSFSPHVDKILSTDASIYDSRSKREMLARLPLPIGVKPITIRATSTSDTDDSVSICSKTNVDKYSYLPAVSVRHGSGFSPLSIHMLLL